MYWLELIACYGRCNCDIVKSLGLAICSNVYTCSERHIFEAEKLEFQLENYSMMQKAMLLSSCYTLHSSTPKTRLLKLVVELM